MTEHNAHRDLDVAVHMTCRSEPDVCPFLEAGDARCDSHFTLGQLSLAFGDCFGAYTACPNYHRLRQTDGVRVLATIHGRRLQPTGT
jgi:hypothetical protein